MLIQWNLSKNGLKILQRLEFEEHAPFKVGHLRMKTFRTKPLIWHISPEVLPLGA